MCLSVCGEGFVGLNKRPPTTCVYFLILSQHKIVSCCIKQHLIMTELSIVADVNSTTAATADGTTLAIRVACGGVITINFSSSDAMVSLATTILQYKFSKPETSDCPAQKSVGAVPEEPEDLPFLTRAHSGELRKCRCWKCQGPHHKRAPSVEIAPPAGEHVEETQCVEETPSFKAFMDAVNADAPDSDNYPDDKSDDRYDHDETSDEPATSSQEHGLN